MFQRSPEYAKITNDALGADEPDECEAGLSLLRPPVPTTAAAELLCPDGCGGLRRTKHTHVCRVCRDTAIERCTSLLRELESVSGALITEETAKVAEFKTSDVGPTTRTRNSKGHKKWQAGVRLLQGALDAYRKRTGVINVV